MPDSASDVIVLGGGAAGLFAASLAAKRGLKVTVLEGNDRPGLKILVSGGGRCNFTNKKVSAENYLSANPHFVKSALSRFTPDDFISLVKKHGIPFHEKKLGQLFCDRSARDILKLLLEECRSAGVEIKTDCRVVDVEKPVDVFHIKTSQGEFFAKNLIVATGGLALPKISTDVGYRIAKRFDIGVTELRPALVPLLWDKLELEKWGGLAGVSLDVVVSLQKKSFRENLLFTHQGLSGPAVLQISSYWKSGNPVKFNLLPDADAKTWLVMAKKNQERKTLKNFFAQKFPEKFSAIFLPQDLASVPLAQIAEKKLIAMADALHAWQVTPAGTEGYGKAEVTVGGVMTEELSSKTMESKKIPGLFFVGEVVDVTGWLGGYNFQWAWSSGFAVAQALLIKKS